MSVCNFTQIITPDTCLGDSLATFNANFSALDEGLCSVPNVVSGLGTHAELELSEQNHHTIRISTKNSFAYDTKFDSKIIATADTISLEDGTSLSVTSFPRIDTPDIVSPLVTFSTVSLTKAAPKVTLFWTASGASNTTVYATNRSTSINLNDSAIKFNGPVTALYYSTSHQSLYVGGEFTTVGDQDCSKFCAIDLNSGDSYFNLGTTGAFVYNPSAPYGGLGPVGTVNVFAEYGDLLIIGGSFQSLKKGRGLTILNRTTGLVYPFYINGTVNDLLVVGDSLYVGGSFDYINYNAQSTSDVSGLRVYANGLTKISLSTLPNFPTRAIDKEFTATAMSLFNDLASINCFAVKSGIIYIGGNFDIKVGTSVIAKNLAILRLDGTINESWKPIVGGEVFTLLVDTDYLYVGGTFRSFHSYTQFNSNPRVNDTSTAAGNAICFRLTDPTQPAIESNWKPRFNGAVTKFAIHDGANGTYLYCYGNFTQINNQPANYLTAVEKSYLNYYAGKEIAGWNVDVQSSPALNNQAMIRYEDSIIVGGTFKEICGQSRFYLARVNGVGESFLTDSLSSVTWDLGVKSCSPGTRLNMDLTNFVTAVSFPGPYGVVNQTTFPINSNETAEYSEGSPLRFFVRRPLGVDSFPYSAHVIGWKVDFN